jgi:dTDP-4-amino-4,6-dideoxygalactose transaminase
MGREPVERGTDSAGGGVPLLDVRPQNEPLQGEILAAIEAVLQSGRFVHGPQCAQFEDALAAYCGVRHAVGCASGSDALLLVLMALGIGPGHEVIVPSFTFFATASAVWRLGARPVFADIDRQSLNLDPEHVERLIGSSTRAIIPVHLFGRCADMGEILPRAERRGIAVLEDVAQAIGAEYDGHRAGSMGLAGCVSFYPTKNLGGFGDGGAITTNDDRLAAQLRILRDHGQDPRYHHHVVGINSRLDTIQAAVLHVKLSQLDRWTEMRIANARLYDRLFHDAGLNSSLGLPPFADQQRIVWNQYTIRVPNGRRDALADELMRHGIGTAIYYPRPLHLQQCFTSPGMSERSLPETERAAHEVLSLPIYPGLTEVCQRLVVERIAEFFRQPSSPLRPLINRPKFLAHPSLKANPPSRPGSVADSRTIPPARHEGGELGQ